MKLTKILSVFLAVLMCVSVMCTAAFAAGITWNSAPVEIEAGKGAYTFRSVYAPAYEMSGHMVTANGGAGYDIPQTLILVNAEQSNQWVPNGEYSYGNSNFEVLYCCDAETGYSNGVYYKRVNLEDSGYYSAEEAAQIRAILTSSYPYVSLDEMKASLKAEGFEYADELDRAEIISAVQVAIWFYANGAEYEYGRSFNVKTNSQWGTVLHDYSDEMSDAINALGRRKFITDENVGKRISALVEYLKGLDPVEAEENQIVISELKITDTVPVSEKDGLYSVNVNAVLNNSGSSEDDNIVLTVYVDGTPYATDVKLGTEEYNIQVTAKAGQTITAVVSGTQNLAKGVYFYEPEGGRDVSQCLVGVAEGETEVYAEASVTLPILSFKAGQASNISFMLINKETGEVKFLYKVDLGSGDTFKMIETEEGYISAVFVKQSTSGMIWTSEKIDDETLENVIKCIKKNNKSYKGYAAVAFGSGEHDLTYKKGKKSHTVTYDFALTYAE